MLLSLMVLIQLNHVSAQFCNNDSDCTGVEICCSNACQMPNICTGDAACLISGGGCIPCNYVPVAQQGGCSVGLVCSSTHTCGSIPTSLGHCPPPISFSCITGHSVVVGDNASTACIGHNYGCEAWGVAIGHCICWDDYAGAGTHCSRCLYPFSPASGCDWADYIATVNGGCCVCDSSSWPTCTTGSDARCSAAWPHCNCSFVGHGGECTGYTGDTTNWAVKFAGPGMPVDPVEQPMDFFADNTAWKHFTTCIFTGNYFARVIYKASPSERDAGAAERIHQDLHLYCCDRTLPNPFTPISYPVIAGGCSNHSLTKISFGTESNDCPSPSNGVNYFCQVNYGGYIGPVVSPLQSTLSTNDYFINVKAVDYVIRPDKGGGNERVGSVNFSIDVDKPSPITDLDLNPSTILPNWSNKSNPTLSWSKVNDVGCGSIGGFAAGYEGRLENITYGGSTFIKDWTLIGPMPSPNTTSFVPNLPDGAYTLYVRGYDMADFWGNGTSPGNRGDADSVDAYIDTTFPSINVSRPKDVEVAGENDILNKTINFTIQDNFDIDENSIYIKVNGTTFNNVYFDDISTTFNGSYCSPWSLSYPDRNATTISCVYDEPLIKPGALTLTICAKDMAGNEVCYVKNFKYAVERRIDMCYRWNAISLPLIPIDPAGDGTPELNPKTTYLLQGVSYDRLSRHNKSDIFDSFAPEIPPVISQSLKELAVGKGYFIFINDTGKAYPTCINKSYHGIPDPSGPELRMDDPRLYFFGIQSNSLLLDDTIENVLSANNITPSEYRGVYYYDKSIDVPYGIFTEYHPSLGSPPFDHFEIGKGYWINYTGTGDTLPLY